VTATLPVPAIQALQVLTIAAGSPGISGIIARVEARLQGRVGPRILQPYYDLAKLFRKEALAPEGTGPFFLLAPIFSFACYLTVPMLIPVLTSFPLPLGYMGDILGGGFILALASFVVAVAAAETGSPYAQLASSRAKTFGAITEPVVLLVVFSVALVTTTDLPYVLGATVRSGPDQIVRPAHLLASGPYLALLRWGSAAKQLVLYTILIDVFIAPWGLSSTTRVDQVGLAIVAFLGKCIVLGCVVAVIDDSFAKLRLFKITEFVAAAFLLAVLGVFTLYLGGG